MEAGLKPFYPVDEGYGKTAADLDGAPLDIDGLPIKAQDLDGVPIRSSDVDGAPLKEIDLDGIPLSAEDIDGMPSKSMLSVLKSRHLLHCVPCLVLKLTI